MRSVMALAGATAMLTALLVSGCDSDVGGSPVTGTTTGPTTGPTTGAASGPSATAKPSGVAALAGDWREDTTTGPSIRAHVQPDGKLTLTKDGQTLKGQVVSLSDTHFRILLISSSGVQPPRVTADLGADGQTMTVTSSDEPGPVVYKKVR